MDPLENDLKPVITNLTTLNGTKIPDDDDIIILDDDDLIQTTYNLLNASVPTRSYDSGTTDHNLNMESQTNAENQSMNNNILIDLTNCDDFDLNDIFLLNSNSILQLNSSNNESNHSTIDQIDTKNNIKDEIDLKMFNFNITNRDFIEEILIDDNPEENIHINSITNNNNNTEVPDDNIDPQRASSEGTGKTVSKKSHYFKCEICSKIFNKLFNYKRHLFMHQSKTLPSDSDSNISTNQSFSINECKNCKRKIIDKSNFIKHIKKCDKNYNTRQLPASHSNEHLQITNKSNSKKLPEVIIEKTSKIKPNKNQAYKCEICSKIFNKRFNYHRHLRVHLLNSLINNPVVDDNNQNNLIHSLGVN